MTGPVSGMNGAWTLPDAASGKLVRNGAGESFAGVLAAAAAKDAPVAAGDAAAPSSRSGKLFEATLLFTDNRECAETSCRCRRGARKLFREAGITSRPPVGLRINPYTGGIEVSGDRPDADRIEQLLAGHPEVGMGVHNALALSGVAYDLPEHLRFQAEYRSSGNPEAVVAKYSHLFGRRTPRDCALQFADGEAAITVDGASWITSGV